MSSVKAIIPFQVMENASETERDNFINSFESIKINDKSEHFILTKNKG